MHYIHNYWLFQILTNDVLVLVLCFSYFFYYFKYIIDIISAHHLNEITIRFWVVAACAWGSRAQISLLQVACHKAHVCKSSWGNNGSKKLTLAGQVKGLRVCSLHYCSANRAFKISELQALHFIGCFFCEKKTRL